MIHRKVVLKFLLSIAAVAIVSVWASHFKSSHHQQVTSSSATTMMSSKSRDMSKDKEYISVAHLGNSIQYYDDLPRFLEHMLTTKFPTVRQNSCLRGGATLTSLYKKGNGVATKFSGKDIGAPTVKDLLLSTPPRSISLPSTTWDFVIINDHTQSPARMETREESKYTLRTKYAPLLLQQQQQEEEQDDDESSEPATTTVIFLQTAAYKSPVKDSDDLGTFDEFTAKLYEGYTEYVDLIRRIRDDNGNTLHAKVAPVGLAYQYLKHNLDDDDDDDTMWAKLYARDDYHPSPHGTFLEACVLYCTMLDEYPPVYDVTWWETARYMQPPDQEPLPLPTDEEANLLRDVAWTVCQKYGGDEDDDDGR
jgi:hypothetical protein